MGTRDPDSWHVLVALASTSTPAGACVKSDGGDVASPTVASARAPSSPGTVDPLRSPLRYRQDDSLSNATSPTAAKLPLPVLPAALPPRKQEVGQTQEASALPCAVPQTP